jgi:sec-independent protein translocase protein TatA
MLVGLGVIGGLGIMELLLIVLMLVILFGASRIPLIARGLGEGIRNFKGGLKGPDQIAPSDRSDDPPRDPGDRSK